MKRFSLLKVTLILAAMFVVGTMSAQVILSETFEKFKAGSPNGGAATTDIAASLNDYTQVPGWTGVQVYQAGGAAKMGGSSKLGYLTTPAIDLSDAAATYTLTFKACAWANAKEATSIKVFVDNEQVYTAENLNKTDYTFSDYTTTITGAAASKVRFEGAQASNGRFFLDDVMITKTKSGEPQPPTLIAPTKLEFPATRLGQSVEKTITVSASNLTGDLVVNLMAVSGGYTTTTTAISKEDAMAGTSFKVTFAPTQKVEYIAAISISGGGLAAAHTVMLTGTGVELTGAGTLENPYTVADVITLNNSSIGPFYVKGYIVGAPVYKKHTEYAAPFTTATALYMGDNVNERDSMKLVPVQLPNGDVRAALNLMDNAANLGKMLVITGELADYFSQPGVKNPTEFTLESETENPSLDVLAQVQFPSIAVGKQISKGITVKAKNLTGDLTVALSGAGFATTVTTLAKDVAMTGTKVDVTFAPTAATAYTATLTFTGGGLAEAVVATLTGKGAILTGEGTVDKPYTVADVIALNNTDLGPYFVKGFIVGAPVFDKASEFAAPFTTNTALYMGDIVSERDTMKLIPVQLTAKPFDARTPLNLMDNPNNLGKELIIKGNLEDYFKVPGIKSPSEFTLNETSISAVQAAGSVIAVGGILVVNTDQAGTVEVYTTVGQIVKTVPVKEGTAEITGLTAGQVYLVKFAGKVQKIVL